MSRIAPGPIPVPTDGRVEDLPARTVTYESRSYPASNCFYSLSTQWSDLSIVHFIMTPFVYDAAAQKLYFIDSIQLLLRTEEKNPPMNLGSIPMPIGSLLRALS